MTTTVQNIIDYADRKYPNVETDANKIVDLNVIYTDLYNRMQQLTDEFSTADSYTIADQATYSLPSQCRIYNITKIQVSRDTRTNVDVNTVWDVYSYAGLNEDISYGEYYGRVNDTTIALFQNGKPIDTTDYVIKFYYYKLPESLSAVTDVLEIDDRYTNLLRYKLVNSLASQGANPDTEIADYYQRMYDEEIEVCFSELQDRFNVAPLEDTQVEGWW